MEDDSNGWVGKVLPDSAGMEVLSPSELAEQSAALDKIAKVRFSDALLACRGGRGAGGVKLSGRVRQRW